MQRPIPHSLVAVFAITLLASPVLAEIRYVDDNAPPGGDGLSWSSPYRFLADALASAPPGAEIRIAGGLYLPDRTSAFPSGSGSRSASFVLTGGLQLLGGYAGYGAADPDLRDPSTILTTLSGDLLGNDASGGNGENSYHVVRVLGSPAANVLDGLAIAHGHANAAAGADSVGGGALVTGGTPTFTAVRFHSNVAMGGGAMRLEAPLAGSALVGCTFEFNAALGGAAMGGGGGAIDVVSGNLSIDSCTFHGNSSAGHGGAVTARPSSGTFSMSHCVVTSSQTAVAGAVLAFMNVVASIRECTFEGNMADAGPGGLSLFEGGGSVVGCTFVGNSGGVAGGVGLWDNTGFSTGFVVANCQFWNNSTASYGAAGMIPPPSILANVVAAQGLAGNSRGAFDGKVDLRHSTLAFNSPDALAGFNGHPTVHNSILWGNSPLQVSGTPEDATVSFSVVQDGWSGGTGVVDADPLFLAPDVHLLSLQEGSPARDAGSLSLVPLDAADLDGDGNAAELLPADIAGGARVQGGNPDAGAYEGDSGYVPPSSGKKSLGSGETAELVAGGGVPGVGAVELTISNQQGPSDAVVTLTQIGYDAQPGATGFTEDGLIADVATTIPPGQHLSQVRIPITLFDLYPHGDLVDMRCTRYDPAVGAWRLAVAMNSAPAANGSGGSPVGAMHLLYSINGSPVTVPSELGDHGVVWQVPELKGYLFANVDCDGQFGIGRDFCGIDIAPGGGDGVVDGHDVGELLASWGSAGAELAADLNGDGVVNESDLGTLLASWGGCVVNSDAAAGEPTMPWADALAALGGPALAKARGSASPARADLTGDGLVDGADLGVLLAAWGGGRSPADLDGSGAVDGADLGLLLSAWGKPAR